MTPNVFKVSNVEYQTVARSRLAILGVSDLGSCCRQWAAIHKTHQLLFTAKGVKNKIRTRVIWKFVLTAFTDEVDTDKNTSAFNVLDVVIPAFSPLQIKGTETMYNTQLITDKGFVASRCDKPLIANPRIRVAKNDQMESWKDESLKLAPGKNWDTITDAHMATTGASNEDTQVLMARGLDALLRLESF